LGKLGKTVSKYAEKEGGGGGPVGNTMIWHLILGEVVILLVT